jgi:hypothetical protein
MQLFSINFKSITIISLLLCAALISSFVTTHRRTITIRFRNKVGSQELVLFNQSYTNPFGEPITVTRFKYYVSHIRIGGAGQKERTLSDKTFLIDEADSASKTLVFTTDVGAPQSLSFELGVDSILNVSGVQTGDLDPLKGMFWTWNSGYIFAKMEGVSDSAHAPAHSFTWDVGGFQSPANASRTVQLSLSAEAAAASNPVIVIDADLLKWFNAKHTLKISQHPFCHQPGNLAMQIADNYAGMFSVAL